MDTEFVLEESVKDELDSGGETLNLLVPEANCHVVENATIEKTLEENSGKSIEKEIKPGETEFDWGRNTLHMQRNNVV